MQYPLAVALPVLGCQGYLGTGVLGILQGESGATGQTKWFSGHAHTLEGSASSSPEIVNHPAAPSPSRSNSRPTSADRGQATPQGQQHRSDSTWLSLLDIKQSSQSILHPRPRTSATLRGLSRAARLRAFDLVVLVVFITAVANTEPRHIEPPRLSHWTTLDRPGLDSTLSPRQQLLMVQSTRGNDIAPSTVLLRPL